jgi:hypothetical protein
MLQEIKNRIEEHNDLFIKIDHPFLCPEIHIGRAIILDDRLFVADGFGPMNLIVPRVVYDTDKGKKIPMILIEFTQLQNGVKVCSRVFASV